jgi:hypothetical protein
MRSARTQFVRFAVFGRHRPRRSAESFGQSIMAAESPEIERDRHVTADEIEELRVSVGWDHIQVTFHPELESFYRKCGFDRFAAGIIDNAAPERRVRPHAQPKVTGARLSHQPMRSQHD